MSRSLALRLAKIALGLAVLVLIIRLIGASEFLTAAAAVKLWPLLPAAGTTAACIFLRVWRWQLISRAQGTELPFTSLLSLTLQGIAVSTFLPTGAGDVAKSYLGYRAHGLKEEMLGSVWADKVVALFSLGLTGGLAAVILGMPGVAIAGWGLSAASFFLLLRPQLIPWSLTARLARMLGTSLRPDKLYSLAALPLPRLAYPLALSVIGWLASALQLYLLALAFSVPASLLFLLAIGPVMGLAELFPFTAAGLGSREAATVYLFSLAGLLPAGAILISLTGFLLAVPLPGLVGIALLGRKSRRSHTPTAERSREREGGPHSTESVQALILTINFPRFTGDVYGSFHLSHLREQARYGLIPIVLAPRIDPAPATNDMDGIKVIRFPWRRRPKTFTPLEFFSWKDYLRLPSLLFSSFRAGRRLLAQEEFQLIASENVLPLGPVAIALGALAKKPVVLTTHGSDLRNFYRTPGVRQALRFVLNRAQTTIAVSSELESYLGEIGTKRTCLVANGVDLSRFSPRTPADDKIGRFRIGCLGGLKPFRNPPAIVEAAALARQHIPGLEVFFGGDGPLAEGMARLIQARSLGNVCTLCGEIDWREVPGFLSDLEVVVFASPVDNVCISLLEAMAAGKAVIAVNSGRTEALVRNEQTGLLVGDDPREIASAMIRLHGDPDLRKRCGKAARRLVEQNSLADRAQRVQAAYRQAIESYSAPRRRRGVAPDRLGRRYA